MNSIGVHLQPLASAVTLKQYLAVMIFATAVAGVTVAVLLAAVNPDQAGPIAAGALLLSLAVAVAGALSILLALLRIFLFRGDALVTRHVRVSVRQGALAAFLLVIALLLSHMRLFAWWSISLAVSALVLAEYFFLSSDAAESDSAFARNG